jgi:hypothetical protein
VLRVSAGAAGEHDRRLGRPDSADPRRHQGVHSANNGSHRGADSQDVMLGHKDQHWRHRCVWVWVCSRVGPPVTIHTESYGVVSSSLPHTGLAGCSCCTHSNSMCFP